MECPLTTWNWEEHFVRGESIDLKLSVQRIFGTMVCLKSLCYASITLLSTALLSDAYLKKFHLLLEFVRELTLFQILSLYSRFFPSL